MEILSPAGNIEKLKSAFYYGADACYLAGKSYGLRAFAGNFTNEELAEAVKLAHSLNKKVYVTLNIYAHNADFNGLEEYAKYLQKIKADGVIVSDLGVMQIIKKAAPKLQIHVSTQANVTNKYAAKALADLGVKRIILARELSVSDIKEIRDYIPQNVELECFVHGAMCISYSGRCLLSNYLSNRDSNKGQCVQACRWNYEIHEINRDNEKLGIEQDSRGTYILNSKDLCLIKHLKELINAGITSFKIEGRMKSPYYVATVTNSYRKALDSVMAGKKVSSTLYNELEKTSHRRFTTGFMFGDKNKEFFLTSTPTQTYEFMAVVVEDAKNGYAKVEQRNRFCVGDTLQVLSPTENFNKNIKITKMQSLDGGEITVADKVQQILLIKTKLTLKAGDMLRMQVLTS